MFKFVFVFATCLVCVAAGFLQPTAFATAPAAVAYANAPLYAAGGSQQIDVRHNYDGTLSSYTTTPFGYTSPISSRYVAAPTALAAPAGLAAPAAFTALAKYVTPAGVAPHLAVASPYAAALAAPFATPFAASPTKLVI